MTGQGRVDDRIGVRQNQTRMMMVRNHDLHSLLFGEPDFVDTRDATVYGNDHLCAALMKLSKRIHAQTVSIIKSVGNKIRNIATDEFQAAIKDRSRSHPIGIVVAVDKDLLLVGNCRVDFLDGFVHAGKFLGSAEPCHFQIEKRLDLLRLRNSAQGKNLGNDWRNVRASFDGLNELGIMSTESPAQSHS